MKTKTKEFYQKQGKASQAKGGRGEDITESIFEKYKPFCQVWRQPASGRKKNKKYKMDFYVRLVFAEDLKWERKVENKNLNKIGVFRWWEKLLTEILSTHIPATTFKENYSDTLIALKLKDLLSIFEDLYRRLGQIKQENTIINYDNKRIVNEIKFSAAKILKYVKKL